MSVNKRKILALFDGDAGGELRYRDMLDFLGLSASEVPVLKRLLAEMVQDDSLRLRKGRWYRLGEGQKTKAKKEATPLPARRLRKQIFSDIYAEENLPVVFPEPVIDEAEALPEAVTEIPDFYEDLRELPLVTIDPVDAKDFDDAVAVLPLDSGTGYRLVVAIADVSYYVRPNTPMDREALSRGTSCYVPGSVVPMLPFRLSAGLCSLKPGEDRLAMAAFLDYAPGARRIATRFAPAVIRSRAALSYEQAQTILDGSRESTDIPVDEAVRSSFVRMKKLFEELLVRRNERGAVDLDIPEAKVRLDEKGEIITIEKASRLSAHRVIEEFMVAANQAVAEFLDTQELPGIYRIHEPPAEEKLGNFAALSRGLGFPFREDAVSGLAINRYLASLKDAPEAAYLNILLLRSFKQARYCEVNQGHFGLALAHYSHFTSPIRRYPDLEIHRLLKRALAGYRTKKEKEGVHARNVLIADQCSKAEQRAVTVERRALSVCQAEYMQRFVGDSFEGRISGVTNFGFFVQISDPYVEGMVHISRLPDYFTFEEETHTLVGGRSGLRYRLGDAVQVKLSRVEVPKGWVDFDLEETEGQPRRRSVPRGKPAARPAPSRARAPKTRSTAKPRKKPAAKSAKSKRR